MRTLIALALCLAAAVCHAERIPVQFVYSKLVPAASQVELAGANPFTWISGIWPYTVPPGFELEISDVQVSSKFARDRASYFVIANVIALPDTTGHVRFYPPLRVPTGVTLRAFLVNNGIEAQWMGGIATGWLNRK